MRVLYIGLLWEGTTTLERMRSLQLLGLHAIGFDVTPFESWPVRIERSIAHRTTFGRPIAALNRALLSFARTQNYDLVWLDKARWVTRETIAELRSRASLGIAVHYTPDAALCQHRTKHFVASLPVYDLCVTTKPFELELYKKFGARDVLLVLQGHGRRFKPHAPEDLIGSVYRSAVSFIGHRQSHYVRVLREVVKSGADLNVWGPGWPAYGRRAAWARRTVRGGPIWGADYPLALASAEIAIGLLSKYIPETTTTRSFEIPASGTFLLAERTPDHQALFDEGREAEFFGELDELVEKIRKYSRDKDARARIAAAGHRRSITSGYSMDVQMGNVLRHLDLRWPNRS